MPSWTLERGQQKMALYATKELLTLAKTYALGEDVLKW